MAELIITAIITAAVSAGVSYIAQKILGGPKKDTAASSVPPDLNDSLSTTINPGGALPGLFGFRRLGGSIQFKSKANDKTYMVVLIAGAPIDGYGNVYINNQLVTFNASNQIQTGPWAVGTTSSIRLWLYDGRQTATNAVMDATFPEWNATTLGKRLAYAVLEFSPNLVDGSNVRVFEEAYKNGLPDITYEVRGFRCYDPRVGTCVLGNESTYVFSSNSAIQEGNYVIHELGMREDPNFVDWSGLIAEADVCDEPVARLSGGTEARYACAAYWLTDQRHEDVLAEIGSTMAGGIIPPGSKYRVYAGRFIPPTANITERSFADDGFSWVEGTPIESIVNTVRVSFSSPSNNWENRDAPEYINATALAEDGGYSRYIDLRLPYVTSVSQAQRLAKISYMFGRFGTSAELHTTLEHLDTIAGDVITVTEESTGINNVSYRVQKDESGQDMTIKFTLSREDATFYAWNAATEERVFSDSTTTTGYSSPLGAPGIILSDGGVSGAGRIIKVDYIPSQSAYVDQYTFSYQVLPAFYATSLGTITPGAGGSLYTQTVPLGSTVNVYATARNGSEYSAQAVGTVTVAPAMSYLKPAPAVGIRWISKTATTYVIEAKKSTDALVTLFELYRVDGYYASANNFVVTSEVMLASNANTVDINYTAFFNGGSISTPGGWYWRTKVTRGVTVAVSAPILITESSIT
jgi:hypothetical protein